jgi:hypothetical protein
VIPRDLAPAILEGEVREVLGRLPDESIHCVVTSPPYWGLRDYGLPPVLWGGSPSCPHEWDSPIPGDPKGGTGTPNGRNVVGAGYARGERRGRFCLSRAAVWASSASSRQRNSSSITSPVSLTRSDGSCDPTERCG